MPRRNGKVRCRNTPRQAQPHKGQKRPRQLRHDEAVVSDVIRDWTLTRQISHESPDERDRAAQR